jgi:chitinase
MSKWSVQLSIDGQTYTFTNTEHLQSEQTKVELAPYLYTWGYNNQVYQINKCMDLYNKLGGKAVTIAFVIGKSCDDIINTFKQDFAEFTKKGGKVTVAFGGANGPYMEEVLDSEAMVNQVNNLISQTGIKSFDFDIEGSYLANNQLNLKRAKILYKLQTQHPDMKLRFTLPADRNGLSQDALNLLTTTQKEGVPITTVNIMAMDIGPVNDWGETAKGMAEKTIEQLRSFFPLVSNIYSKLGITTMIGKNDDGSIFRSNDMSTLVKYCQEKQVALLSFWSINRDQVGTGDLSVYSQVNTRNFEYYEKATLVLGK